MSGNESPFSEDQWQLLKLIKADVVKEALPVEREKNSTSSEKQLPPQDTERPGMSSSLVSLICLHCGRSLIRRGGAGIRLLRVGWARRPGMAECHMGSK